MIGTIDRNETFGVPGGFEDNPSIVDSYDLVSRRVYDHQRMTQARDALSLWLKSQVLQELSTNEESLSGNLDGRLSAFDLLLCVTEQMPEMRRLCGSPDRDNRANLRN